MNTPAHLAASILVWRNEDRWLTVSAIASGALIPDAPMFAFYAYQRLVAGRSENAIWSTLYFQDSWQLLFDLFNSLPFALGIVIASLVYKLRWGVLFGASASLHQAADFLLHHDDAHRHFLPFTGWRFASPVSYWDPKHYGFVFIWFELAFAVLTCCYVGKFGQNRPMRSMALMTLALYAAGMVFAIVMWVGIG